MGNKGPFSFAGWKYYFPNPSVPKGYPQAIYNIASQPGPHPQVITVTAPAGILLCGIAGSGYAQATTATIQGTTLSATTVLKSGVAFPAWTAYANATFDATWQPLQSISINTIGDQIGPSVVNLIRRSCHLKRGLATSLSVQALLLELNCILGLTMRCPACVAWLL